MTFLSAQPKVSIITPVYNGAEYLEELILSVLAQDYPNIEHIIIDDGSSDEGATIAILQRYPHLKWWSRENRGQYATMNEGLFEAEGKYICFICSDDWLSNNAVSEAMEWIKIHPQCQGVYGRTSYMSTDGESLLSYYPFRKAPLRYYPYFCQLQHCSFYITKESLIKDDLTFTPERHLVGDYDWMLRILKSGIQIGFIDSVLSTIRVHENQLSTINKSEIKRRHKEIANLYGYGGIQYTFFSFILIMFNFLGELCYSFQNNNIKGAVKVFQKWFNKGLRYIKKRR